MYQIDSYDPRTDTSSVDGHFVDLKACKARFAAIKAERPGECHYARKMSANASRFALASYMPATHHTDMWYAGMKASR